MLHFASQAEADTYAVQQELQAASIRQHRRTRAQSRHIAHLESRHAASLSPVYRLTDDILEEILSVAVMGEEGVSLISSVTLSSVVVRFRRVALATPALWTVLPIRYGRLVRTYEWSRTLASRSGALPLVVQIRVSDADEWPDLLDLLMTVLGPYAFDVIPRMRELSLRGPELTMDLPRPLLFKKTEDCSLLFQLSVLDISECDIDSWGSFIYFLEDCPELQAVKLLSFGLSASGQRMLSVEHRNRVLPGLQSLELELWASEDLLFLAKVPNLRHLKVHVHEEEIIQDPIFDPDFSSVRDFELCSGEFSMWALLETICTLTGLETIRLLGTAVVLAEPNVPVSDNLLYPPIRSLEVNRCGGFDRVVRVLVEGTTGGNGRTPSLKTVKLLHCPLTEIPQDTRDWLRTRVEELIES